MQTTLAPDGKTLACIDGQFNLRLIDVATAQTVFEKKQFYLPTAWDVLAVVLSRLSESPGRLFQFAYTPDGRYLLAARAFSYIAVDVPARRVISLPGSVGDFLGGGFTFFGSDRMAGIKPERASNSAFVRFPSGQVIDKLPISPRTLQAPTHGDHYLIVRPAQKYAVGVVELSSKKVIFANLTPAFDIYDDVFVSERKTGEVGLYRVQNRELLAAASLPKSPLGRLQAVALSPDFRELALSQRSRGAVWNLSTGEQIAYVIGFRGAYLGEEGAAYLDFPKSRKQPHTVAKIDLQHSETRIIEIEDPVAAMADNQPSEEETNSPSTPAQIKLKAWRAQQYGRFLIATNPLDPKKSPVKNIDLTVYDAVTGKQLWTRHFDEERPAIEPSSSHQNIVLVWNTDQKSAQDLITADAAVKARYASLGEKKGVALLEVDNLATGKLLSRVLVETGAGSFRLRGVAVAGDYLLIVDNQNRVMLYSLSSGTPLAKVFGNHATLSLESGLVLVENTPGQTSLYSLPILEKRDELSFAAPVSYAQFSPDGKKIFVLTEDQVAYTVAVASGTTAATAVTQH